MEIKVTLVVAHPRPTDRARIVRLLSLGGSIRVLGDVADQDALIGRYRACPPDVLVVSTRFCQTVGLTELLKAVRTWCPPARVLLTSPWNDYRDVKSALKNGAFGYVLECDGSGELHQAVLSVAAQHVYVSRRVNWLGRARVTDSVTA